MWVDVRCDGTRTKGPKKGVMCRDLLVRVSSDTVGEFETKCGRCNRLRVWVFTGMLVAVSS